MEIYTYDKSLQERLVEYTEILLGRDEIIPASGIKHEWSSYIELVIEPVGWRALWKIPRLTCQDFEIHYPTIVVVMVEGTDFYDLSASVKITAVQDDIHLPERYDVPLDELYPTIEQVNQVLDAEGTSNCIDQLRFFYQNIWMPWDLDDDDNEDWARTHLESRIRLFFDTKRGAVDKETRDLIETLIREGKEVQRRIDSLEFQIMDEQDDEYECQLMTLHLRLRRIKSEMEVMENPAMRDVIRRNRGETETENRREQRREGYFVWHGGSVKDTVDCLNRAKEFIGDDVFLKLTGCLNEALYSSKMGDIIAIGEGEHRIRGAGGLEEGGTLRGIGNTETTVISPKEAESGRSLFDFSGGEVSLQNVLLDLGELQAGILVRGGTVRIIGCKIFVSSRSVIKLGIVVLSGGKLIAKDTIFSSLGTGLTVHPDGRAILERCKFEDCVEGVQLYDEANLNATKCNFSGLKEYGIRMETQKCTSGRDGQIDDEGLLFGVSEITISDCSFENNGKNDIALRPKLATALAPIQDGAIGMQIF